MKKLKTCSKCGDPLTLLNGIVRKTGLAAGRFRSECRRCGALLAKAWRVKNPTRVLETARNWKILNPGKAADYKRKATYGISASEFESAVAEQDNKCLICLAEMTPSKNRHVDHDHVTGKVRGLLCSKCNTGLGLFDDSPERLLAAAAYLRRTS